VHLTQALHRHVRQSPQACAACDERSALSWAELADRVARFAGALKRDGLQPGDRVALLARNQVDYLVYVLGVFWAGGVITPVNWRWSPPEIAASLLDSGARILLLAEEFIAIAGDILPQASGVTRVVAMTERPPDPMVAYAEWLAGASPVPDALRKGDDLAALMYSGGTTGRPKGVMLSHANIAASNFGILVATDAPATKVHLHVAPLFHIGALSNLFLALTVGATSVFLPVFDPPALVAAVNRWRVTELFLVPTMIRLVIDHPDFRAGGLPSVRRLRYGAAAIDETLLDRTMAALPGAEFVQAYGMTELGPVATVLPPSDHLPERRTAARLRSAGRATPTCEVRVLDPDGAERSAGETGEIVARGPNVMLGYWQDPDATAQVLRNGWMHTGDLGFMDADGYLTVADRLKDMIVTGGENVSSAEVENALATHPDVGQAAVIAVPDALWGERVHAVIVPRAGAQLRCESIIAHCRPRLAGYKLPRSLTVIEELPLSPAGKVLKSALRQRALKEKW
jgi:acyl-CoA synthetase (AMP-forming)/AMP-acid ligase II